MNKFLVCATLSAALLFAADSDAPSSGVTAAALQPFVDNHTLPGAVTLVASKDKVLDVETIGYADIANKKPMRADTLFWIASMSKPITTTAFMILVGEGKINVDDPVEKYLPEFKGQWLEAEHDADHILLKKPVHPITVRNILTHTSGLPFSSPIEKPTLDRFQLRDAVNSYATNALVFQPGSKYQYANAGINTAARILEVVSGMPYEQFLQTRLFTPLGMTDTTFWPNAEQLQRLAVSYQPSKDGQGLEETTVTQLTYPLDGPNRYPMPAGGLFSTAHDLARFGQMILNNGTFEGKQYLTEAALRQMTSLQTGDIRFNGKSVAPYGFGWSVLKGAAKDGRSATSFGHGGAYKTMLWVDPQKEVALVLLRHLAGTATTPMKDAEAAFFKAAITKYGK